MYLFKFKSTAIELLSSEFKWVDWNHNILNKLHNQRIYDCECGLARFRITLYIMCMNRIYKKMMRHTYL